MVTTSLITDEMRAMVGKASEPWTTELDRSGCRLFARSIGYTDPVYYDEAVAKQRGFRDIPAPPGFLGTPVYNPNVRSAADDDAERRLDWVTAGLNGGTDIEYFDTVCAGDVLEARRQITSWTERESRMGRMVILKQDIEYSRDGKLVAIDHGTSLLVAGGTE